MIACFLAATFDTLSKYKVCEKLKVMLKKNKKQVHNFIEEAVILFITYLLLYERNFLNASIEMRLFLRNKMK
jgi:hypothetical protein